MCTANICRSPMIEHLLRNALAERTHDGLPRFVVHSAGTQGWAGAEMDPAAAAELRRLGGDPSSFRARDLTRAQCDAADLILTATAEHRAYVLQEYPRALRRTFTLLQFAHLVSTVASVRQAWGDPVQLVGKASAARGSSMLAEHDVPDPYGRPTGIHERVAETVAEAVLEIRLALSCSSAPTNQTN